MKAVLASRNKKKIAEMRTLLSRFTELEILSLDDIGLIGDIEETGEDFESNALIKASAAMKKSGYIGIADDSGLEVDALDGRPGVYSARYAGEPCDDERNIQKLLEELRGLPQEGRSARFVSVIATVFPDGRSFTVRGECEGRILEEKRGEGGFGYDPVFFYPPLAATFSQISAEEKNKISHRAKSMELFGEKISQILNK